MTRSCNPGWGRVRETGGTGYVQKKLLEIWEFNLLGRFSDDLVLLMVGP